MLLHTLSLHDALPIFTQLKHETDADNIALSKGTEMLLVRAENELRSNENVGEAISLINEGRVYHGLEPVTAASIDRSEEHTSELQSRGHLVCRLLVE